MARFDYLLRKIRDAPIRREPFEHVYLPDFFSEADFQQIIASTEIALKPARNDSELFDVLYEAGYSIIEFPGCIANSKRYMRWRKRGGRDAAIHSACEGFGVTLRLGRYQSDIIKDLSEFLLSEGFNVCIADKFGIALEDCSRDHGIQKYLDGYEISPHPDRRKKALTFMVNVNPNPESHDAIHHTHYLRLKPEWRFVQSFWEGNDSVDRDWVPWGWCTTDFTQSRNNSIVLFPPSDNSLHSVKADYDHFTHQRTQLYGNLWYRESPELLNVGWEKFADLKNGSPSIGHRGAGSTASRFKSALPQPLRKKLREIIRQEHKNKHKVMSRQYVQPLAARPDADEQQ